MRQVDRVAVEASGGQRSTRGGVTENVTPGRIRMTRRITNLHHANCRGQRWGGSGRAVLAQPRWTTPRDKIEKIKIEGCFMNLSFFFLSGEKTCVLPQIEVSLWPPFRGDM